MPPPPGYASWIERRLRQWMDLHGVSTPQDSEMKCLVALGLEASDKLSPEYSPLIAGSVASFVGTAYFSPQSPFYPYLRRYVETCQAGGRPTLGIDLSPGAPPPPGVAAGEAMPADLAEKLRSFFRPL